MHFYSCAIKHFWEEEMVEPLTICFIFLSSYKLLIPVTLKSFFVLSLLFNRFLPTSWRSSHTGILYHVSPPKLLKFMMQRSWVIRVKISILLHRWLLYIETSLWIETEWQLLYIKHHFEDSTCMDIKLSHKGPCWLGGSKKGGPDCMVIRFKILVYVFYLDERCD